MHKFALGFLIFAVTFMPAFAVEPAIWSVSTRADILKGDARGVSISADGSISLAPRLDEMYKTEQPYIWSSVFDASGNIILGTGGDGRVFRVNKTGAGALLADMPELNVTALAIGRGGDLFAATSPDGKVYRIDAAGKAETYFDPKEKYIWSLAAMSDGSLAVGTGENGRIYRIRAANSAPEASLFFDASDTHITSLAADNFGNLYAGTDSNGIVMKFGMDGKPFALVDSPLREITEIAVSPDGTVYALAVGESASAAVTLPAAAAAESKPVSAERNSPAAPETPQKSRYDLAGAKSAVYRVQVDGGSDILWSSPAVTGFSLYAHRTNNGVLLGTSDKGRIYSISNEAEETLILQSGTSQISTIFSDGQNLFATSSNQGRLFRFGQERIGEGTYESAVLDAKGTASWGRIWWNSTGNVEIQTRSGNTEKADETWSTWAAVAGTARTGPVTSPKARYLQWRAVLRGSGASLSETSVAYLPRNIAPEVLSIQILPTNVGLVPNPPMQVDPNIELSGLDPAVFGIPNAQVPPRRVYQRGARSFQWTAEDRNGDKLVYDVLYKEAKESAFKLLKENIPENFITLDGQSLADGRYTLKIAAKDSRENPPGQFLRGERVSEPFDLDNTAPIVTVISGNAGTAVFAATDAASFINGAEYSVNGGEWIAVYADDGIADSPNERFTIRLATEPPGELAVTLRVFDVNGNSGNARVIARE